MIEIKSTHPKYSHMTRFWLPKWGTTLSEFLGQGLKGKEHTCWFFFFFSSSFFLESDLMAGFGVAISAEMPFHSEVKAACCG